MKRLGYLMFGFLGFTLVTGFNVSVAVLFYSKIEYKENYQIALLMLVVIFFNAFLCSLIDVLRRKIMIENPLNEILYATKQITKGNFKIRLVPHHSYEYYDEFDKIKENLNIMTKELSKNEILKNDFISNVSHEIKTPLAIIMQYAKVLEKDNLTDEERRVYLNNLQESCKRLNTLVMNILKLNKLENNKLDSDVENFNLSNLLESQILMFEELLEQKNISLDCDIEEDLKINSIKNYIEIVVNNLMSNAIKFTDAGGKIKVSLNKDDEKYIIVVEDNGCGMSSETGYHMFDKFYQGNTAHSSEGNGLGLALVKKVIDILGGTISVKSELGIGTTFTIIIMENE